MRIKLGQKVRDVVTGFTGIAEARTEWMNGCVRITVQPRAFKKDGALVVPDNKTFDEEQLAIVTAEPLALPRSRRTGGGGRAGPPARIDPL